MIQCKKHKIISETNGKRTEAEKISIIEKGANIPKDKIDLIIFLIDNLTADYEIKLACVTKELIKKDCQYEDILTAEQHQLISVLNSLYNAIDNIKIVEGMTKI